MLIGFSLQKKIFTVYLPAMLKRYFLSNLMIMVFLNLLVKPIWIFLIDRNVQLLVGHADYGLYSALMSMSIIFSILLDFGITNYNNRHIAGDSTRIEFSLPNMMVAKLAFSLVYFGVLFSVAYFIHYEAKALHVLFLLGCVQFLNSFLQFLRSNVSANHDFVMDSLLSVIDKVVMILSCGLMLTLFRWRSLFTIEWYLYAQIGAYLFAVLIALGIIIRRYSRIDFRYVSIRGTWNFIVESAPYAMLILLMGIYMRSDSLLLERLVGAQAGSVYAEAYRILDALNMIGFLLAGILLPMFTRMISRLGDPSSLVRSSTNIVFSMSLAVLAHSWFYANDIMHFLDHQADKDLPQIYQLVIASFPAYCIMYIYSTLLTANGNIRLLIRMALLGSLLSIGLNLWLIPSFQARGAAVSALIVQYTMAAISLYYCIRYFHLGIDAMRMIKFIGLFLVLAFCNAVLHRYGIPLLYSMILNVPVYLSYVYAIRLWDWRDISAYIKQFKSTESR